MKFFALSLIGLSFLAQQTEAQINKSLLTDSVGDSSSMSPSTNTLSPFGVSFLSEGSSFIEGNIFSPNLFNQQPTNNGLEMNRNSINGIQNQNTGSNFSPFGFDQNKNTVPDFSSFKSKQAMPLPNIGSGSSGDLSFSSFGSNNFRNPGFPTIDFGSTPFPTNSFPNASSIPIPNISQLNNRFKFNGWNIFDNSQIFCQNPRIWTGSHCICPNNQIYLSGKCYNNYPSFNDDILSLRFINRNFDGTQNNPNHPEWGMKSAEAIRICKANYEDGVSKMVSNLPNPRAVSNAVGAIGNFVQPNRGGVNMIFGEFGQFIAHDIATLPDGDQAANIPIPKCDAFFDQNCSGAQKFEFFRTIFNKNKQVRTPINSNTPWIDASQIYGTDKATADSLRELSRGKLKTSNNNLLPKDDKGQFMAGNDQVNQNSALISFHTIFMRQHNRICDLVFARNSSLTDEEIYQIARNYVTGLYQHFVMYEFLPILIGNNNFRNLIGPYRYDVNADPTIIIEFAVAAYRLGHPLINTPLKLMDNNGKVIRNLKLGEMFINPNLISNESIDQILNGLIRVPAKQRTLEIVDDLRNFSMLTPNVKFDLFTFNVHRGRDNGICSLNNARQQMGLQRKNNFRQIFANVNKADALQKLYGSTDRLDLWLGIIGEPSMPGALLGELGISIVARQFKNIINGDRYWYENVFPRQIIRQIKSTSFADVIKRNTGVRNINAQAFKRL